jgi:hypothetical protein
MKRIIIIASALVLAYCSIFASLGVPDNSSVVSGLYSTIGVGAAASGMGNAYLGSAQDAVAIFWNPAGIENIQKEDNSYSLFFSHNQWLMSTIIESLSFATKVKDIGAFAVGFSYFNSGEMERYGIDEAGHPIDLNSTFSTYSFNGNISYSNKLDRDVDFGVTFKYYLDDMDGSVADAIAFDLGVRYFVPIVKGLSFDLVATNFGGEFNGYTMSKEVSFAALYKFAVADWGVNAEYDLVGRLNNIAVNRFGLEIKCPYLLILRAGYFTEDDAIDSGFKDISFGLGMVVNSKYNVDFSFEPYGELGNAFKLSFGADF